jgi:hypothetical protein
MGERRLPADDLRHHARNKRRIGAQLGIFAGVFVQRQHAAADRVAGRVVAADDQEDEVPENSILSMFRVASPCASIEIRSFPGGAFTRSFHRFRK